MAERRVLLGRESEARAGSHAWDERFTYTVIGWVSAVLALTGLTDFGLALYPLGFGSAEWEMATVGAVVQGLPLLSIGLAGVWISAGATGRRWLLLMLVAFLVVGALALGGLLLLFVTDIPQATRATDGFARQGIYKLVARTVLLGGVYTLAYVVAAIATLRQARKINKKLGT